jgi:hypothetical protein
VTLTITPRTSPGEPEPPEPPLPRGHETTATRYLCVGAYLDDTFRDRCLREVYYETRRFVAPSHGFDLVMVLETCLRARNLAMWRDTAIVTVLAVAAYLNWLSVAAVGAALLLLRVTGAGWNLIRAFLVRARTGTAVDTTKSPRRGLLLLLSWAATCFVLILLASRIVSSAASSVAGARSVGTGGAVLLIASVFVLPSVFALWRQKRIEDFRAGGRPPPVRRTRRMTEIDEQQHGNTVVYSNFEPFIGSGDVMSSWGFAQRLVRKEPDDAAAGIRPSPEGEREFPEPPFTAEDIVDYVREHLRTLTTEMTPELRIPDMTVEDRIFHSAREYGKRSLITGPAEMAEIIRNPTSPDRHYLVCRAIGWGGDVVTTVHIHLAVQGRSLYLEVTSTTLAPCNERYRIVDLHGGTGPHAWLRAVATAVRYTPNTIVRAPGRLTRALADILGQGTGWLGMPGRDDGAQVSVRQIGTRDKLRNFTQRQDILKFKRLIESRVYAHVLDFLDERGVDTTEVRAQRAQHLSVGVGVFGGEMTVNGNVVGQQTTTQQPSQK